MSLRFDARVGNSWELRVYAGTDPETGKRKSVSATTTGSRRGAQRALAESVARVDYPRRMAAHATVADSLRDWSQAMSPTTGLPPRLARTRASSTAIWCPNSAAASCRRWLMTAQGPYGHPAYLPGHRGDLSRSSSLASSTSEKQICGEVGRARVRGRRYEHRGPGGQDHGAGDLCGRGCVRKALRLPLLVGRPSPSPVRSGRLVVPAVDQEFPDPHPLARRGSPRLALTYDWRAGLCRRRAVQYQPSRRQLAGRDKKPATGRRPRAGCYSR